MEDQYNLKGVICFGDQEYLIQYGPHATLTCPIHPNQTKLAEKLVGTGMMVKFYIRSCPDMRNGGELEDFAILADNESSDRIKAAMNALEGKQLFRGLNEHATEMLKNTDLSVINGKVDLINEISVYANEQIGLGKIKPHQKSWFESVCMYWYEKRNTKIK